MSAADVLTRARDLVARPNGWCQNNYSMPLSDITGQWEDRGDKAYCLLGAMEACLDTSTSWAELRWITARAIGTSENAVASWNDHPARTQEQVIFAFDCAIAIALEQEAERG